MKKKWKISMIILSVLLIVLISITFTLNHQKEKDKNEISIELEQYESTIEKDTFGNSIIQAGKIDSYSYYYYGIRSIKIISNEKEYSLEEASKKNILNFQELIRKMKIDKTSTEKITIYKYNGNTSFGKNKFSIVNCRNIYIIGEYNANYPLEFCQTN